MPTRPSLITERRCSCRQHSHRLSQSNPLPIKQLWVIEDPLPQYCIIDTSALRNYPKIFNRIGFYCWHEYESNPELIEIAYGRDE